MRPEKERDQKWFLDQVAAGKAGLEMPCIILATALGVNLANELLWRNTWQRSDEIVRRACCIITNHSGKCTMVLVLTFISDCKNVLQEAKSNVPSDKT